jgi:hypothetical protein
MASMPLALQQARPATEQIRGGAHTLVFICLEHVWIFLPEAKMSYFFVSFLTFVRRITGVM